MTKPFSRDIMVSNGLEAVFAETIRSDLILIDMNMPQMGGFEL
jgi:CheY-like chemotaxis protein